MAWLKELKEQPSAECDPSVSTSSFSVRRSKITVEEPLEDLESENTETWQNWKAPWPRFRSQWKTAGEDQQIGDLSFLSRKCWTCGKFTKQKRTWMFQCQNESCSSHETYLAFPTTEKSRAFVINHIVHRFLAFELSVAVTRQPQTFLVFSVCISGTTI